MLERIRELGESEQFFCAIILYWKMFVLCLFLAVSFMLVIWDLGVGSLQL